MMISPENYVEQFSKASYQEMIKERDNLFGYIKKFETMKKPGTDFNGEDMIDPQPDVIYLVLCQYLKQIKMRIFHRKINICSLSCIYTII